MGLNDVGYLGWKPGMLAWIEIREEGEVPGSLTVEQLYEPNDEDIKKMCYRYNFPFIYVMNLLGKRDPEVKGFVFDVKKFKEHLREKGYRV